MSIHIGQPIGSIKLEDDKLTLAFGWRGSLVLEDVGQSCCENRYMTTDDKLDEFLGATFLGFEIKDAPNEKAESEHGWSSNEHEVQFLEVKTSKGSFTVKSHNEHNGYYGGFDIEARWVGE